MNDRQIEIINDSLLCPAVMSLQRDVAVIFVIAACVISSMYDSANGLCTFPKSWRGVWFQVDYGDVIIGQSNISRHGNCYHAERGYYLIDNRELDCQTCMLIEQRHQNVLQYQQSFCAQRDVMYKACLGLDAETVQHTLIRELNHQQLPSVSCPLVDAYHFSYVNNSGGLCAYPASYVTPCASASRVRFHFKRCPDAAYAYERDVDVQCVATWVDGSYGYFIGRVSSSRASDSAYRHNRYRCFMYRVHGTVIYMSMSADASCRGLVSPRDGPTTLELTQDVFGWPKSQCMFPAWTTRNVWRDLTGRHLYAANDMGDVMEIRYRASLASVPEVNKSLRCYRVLARNTTTDHVTAVAFVMFGCSAKYQCVKFVKRKEGVIEIHEGRYVDRADEFCYESEMLDSNKRILIADTPTQSSSVPCPFQGQHVVQHADDSTDRSCRTHFRSGCNGTNVIDVVDTCTQRLELRMECIRSWREHKKHFVIAKSQDTESTAACYSFRKMRSTDTSLEFHSEPTCDVTGSSTASSTSQTDGLMYIIDQNAAECRVKSELLPKHVQPVTSSFNTATSDPQDDNPVQADNDRGQQNRYGGRYRHVEKNSFFDDDDDDDDGDDNEQPHDNSRQMQSHQRLVFICTSFVTGLRMLCMQAFLQSV